MFYFKKTELVSTKLLHYECLTSKYFGIRSYDFDYEMLFTRCATLKLQLRHSKSKINLKQLQKTLKHFQLSKYFKVLIRILKLKMLINVFLKTY